MPYGTHVIHISTPFQCVNIKNNYESHCPNIYIPAKSEMTGSFDTSAQRYFFTTVNATYQNIINCGMWYELQLITSSKRRKHRLRIGISEFPL